MELSTEKLTLHLLLNQWEISSLQSRLWHCLLPLTESSALSVPVSFAQGTQQLFPKEQPFLTASSMLKRPWSKKPPLHQCFGDLPAPSVSQTSLQTGNLFWEASLAPSTGCKVCQPHLEKPSHCKCGLQLMTKQLLIPGVDSPVALHRGCNLGAWCLHTPLLQRCRCHSDAPCWHMAAH